MKARLVLDSRPCSGFLLGLVIRVPAEAAGVGSSNERPPFEALASESGSALDRSADAAAMCAEVVRLSPDDVGLRAVPGHG